MNDVTYPEDFSNYVIGSGEKGAIQKADNSRTNSSAALSLITQARRTIDIFTHNLDPRVLDTPEVAAAISAFVKISPNSVLRILLNDPTQAVKQGHRFIELSRKFSSFISIRLIHEEYRTTPYSFLIVDSTGLLYRPHADEYHAIVNFNARYDCRQHLEFFNEVWNRSEPISETRQ